MKGGHSGDTVMYNQCIVVKTDGMECNDIEQYDDDIGEGTHTQLHVQHKK